jgi:hypothetical protein
MIFVCEKLKIVPLPYRSHVMNGGQPKVLYEVGEMAEGARWRLGGGLKGGGVRDWGGVPKPNSCDMLSACGPLLPRTQVLP